MIIIKASVICLGILINYRAYNVLFLVLSVTFSFFLVAHQISRESLNGFVPNRREDVFDPLL